jgi:LysR family transcriptional regulator, nitrogen assimilation regulatory protein
MELEQIEYFVRVAELGSFTRASSALGIAQPALSRKIRQLEVELRQNLLVRNGRGATTTDAGKLLLEHGRGILHQVQRLREELGRVRGSLAGRVAIGLPPSIAKVLTVPLTREFRAKLPQAALSISEGLSVAMQDAIINGKLDIALLYGAVPTQGLEITHLLDEELCLVQRKSERQSERQSQKLHPEAVNLKDVAALPLIIPTRPNAIRMLVEAEMANINCRPNITLEIDGVPAILDLVLDGAGCAVLSKNAVTTSGQASLFAVSPIAGLHSKLSVAVSAQRPATLTQQAMLELIQQLVSTTLNTTSKTTFNTSKIPSK